MFHENVRFGIGCISYYDKVEEIPDMCVVSFPEEDGRKPAVMNMQGMLALARTEEWYVIAPDHNYGVCDHWVSIPFRRWINERYTRVDEYTDKGKTIGYKRHYSSVTLTKDKHFSYSEVWNS